MSITSFEFLGFVLASLVLFRLFPLKHRWWVLLAASVVFYLSFSVYGIFVMTATALVTYFVALKVQKYKDTYSDWLKENKKTADKETRKAKKSFYQKKQKLIVAGCVILTLSVLFLCKYYKVLAVGFNSRLGTNMWTAENIMVPIGISYYSLQLIGYLVDVNRDIITAERNPLKVILFGGFFLSIMQGPFNRYNELMPQLCPADKKKLSYRDVKFAILRIMTGYIKKMCIADQVGIIANEVFSNYQSYEGLGIFFGMVCFAIQLYADFAGYMDIIIGIGQLFGINMPENFKQPFFTRSISEFWQKWHITLGAWLKDYVFYSLLKSKAFKEFGKWLSGKVSKETARKVPTYVGMFILWTLIGTWHGAGINYIFSVGWLQFLYIFLGEICDPLFKKVKKFLRINDRKLYWHIFQSLRTTALMMFAWIFFNTKSISDALKVIKRLSVVPSLSQIALIIDNGVAGSETPNWLIFVCLCAVILLVVDLLHENNRSLSGVICKRCYPVRLMYYMALIYSLIIFGAYGEQYVAANFLYFAF